MSNFTKTVFFFFVVMPFLLKGQDDSYQYRIEVDSFNFYGGIPFTTNENNDIFILLRIPNGKSTLDFVKLPAINGYCQGYSYTAVDITSPPPYSTGSFIARGNWVFYSATWINNFSHLVALNLNNGTHWSKTFFSPYYSSKAYISFGNDGDVLALNEIDWGNGQFGSIYPKRGVLEVFRMDSLGNDLWKTALLFKEAPQGDTMRTVKPNGFKIDSYGNMYITGVLQGFNLTLPSSQFLLKLDANGIPISWKLLKEMSFNSSLFADDGIYLLGRSRRFPYAGGLNNWGSVIIAKLDYDFNLIWLKKYYAENFSCERMNIATSHAGGLYLSTSDDDVNSTIFAELDANGNIMKQKGYPNYDSFSRPLSDGSIALTSVANVDNNGLLGLHSIITKTDEQGEIEGCNTIAGCLEVTDTSVAYDSFYVHTHPVLDLTEAPIIVEPVSYAVTPFCDYPPPPLPTFSLPDTLCLGTTATTLSDNNRLAQTREWQLTGPGVDSTLRDSFEFRYQFTQTGQYLLRQSVWVLGCRSDYERSVTVLPPLSAAIAADSLLCPDEPQEISASASRAAVFVWNTGVSGSTLPLTASGTYTVTATDGHCSATDSVSVTVVAALLGGQPPFALPPDTTVCGRDLPYLLTPKSAFSDLFLFENGAVQAASYPLTEAGTFPVRMEAFGCEFQRVFRLTVDCHADVYVPNSFSPNGDGINDLFQPFGTDFQVLELSVYDRWGGLRHRGTDAWDGGSATQGVYAFRLVYRDMLSLEEVTREGEVVLVR